MSALLYFDVIVKLTNMLGRLGQDCTIKTVSSTPLVLANTIRLFQVNIGNVCAGHVTCSPCRLE